METIKEEEHKDIPMKTSNSHKNSKFAAKKKDDDIEPRKCKSLNKEIAPLDVSRCTNNEKVELKQLEEIEKQFVAFLLPWLKLVPNFPSGQNFSITTEYNKGALKEENSKKRLDNSLNSLSKVRNNLIILEFYEGLE